MTAPTSGARERPILFSAPMVRALLAGTKTQTRRVVKHKWPYLWGPNYYPTGKVLSGLHNQPGAFMEFRARQQDEPGYDGSPSPYLVPCPYGQPGDRLWVKETWRTADTLDSLSPAAIADKCLDAGYSTPWAPLQWEADGHRNGAWGSLGPGNGGVVGPGKTRVSIHMPRWASRMRLQLTEVRVERLQDCSEADALAEGIVRVGDGFGLPDGSHYHHTDPRQSYFSLWEAINGAGSVEANPWVWAVTFRLFAGTP